MAAPKSNKKQKELEFEFNECKKSMAEVYSKLLFEMNIGKVPSVSGSVHKQNILYDAICSNNIELIKRTIDESRLAKNAKVLDLLLSEAYRFVKLNNILISDEMEIFIQDKIISLRFCSAEILVAPSLSNVEERICMVLEKISDLESVFTVDEIFIYIIKNIAQNMYILKQQLKITFTELPWEEIVFCLVCFISTHTKQQELNFFYRSVLTKERVMEHLLVFRKHLQNLKDMIPSMDVNKLNSSTRTARDIIAAGVLKTFPEYQKIYNDFVELRDVYSLDKMNNYINASLLVDCESKEGQLILKRTLQVIGEQLKNTLDSPNLSTAVSEQLLLSAPKETRQVLTALRNSLSHAHVLQKKENSGNDFFANIQNDVKKIGAIISEMLYFKLVNKIKMILIRIGDCQSFEEFYSILEALRDIDISNYPKSKNADKTTKEQWKISEMIEEINKQAGNQTETEKNIYLEIKKMFQQSKDIIKNLFEQYNSALSMAKAFFELSLQDKAVISRLDLSKEKILTVRLSKKMTPTLSSLDQKNLDEMIAMLKKFYYSIEPNTSNDVRLSIKRIIDRISHISAYDKDSIKWIDDFKDKILMKKGKEIKKVAVIVEPKISKKDKKSKGKGKGKKSKENKDSDNAENPTDIEDMVEAKKTSSKHKNELDTKHTYLEAKKDAQNYSKLDGQNVEELKNVTNATILNQESKLNQEDNTNVIDIILATEETNASDQSLNEKLLDLSEIINSHSTDVAYESFLKSDNNTLFAVEMLLLDIMSDLDNAKCLIGSPLFLDNNAPLLTGRVLRNHLAHGSPLVEAMYPENHIAILLNAKKLTENSIDYNLKYGYIIHHDINKIETDYAKGLEVIQKQTKLREALKGGNLEDLKQHLEAGVDVNFRKINMQTALHLAAERPSLEIIKYLVQEKKLNANAEDTKGRIPLHISAINGRSDHIKYFAEELHVKVFKTDHNSESPLHLSAQNGHKDAVKTLIGFGANKTAKNLLCCCALHYAVRNDHLETVKVFLDNNVDVNLREGIAGFTSLHLAAQYGHKELVEYLLDNNADVNFSNYDGTRPLHLAANLDHFEIVKILVQRGAKVNFKRTGTGTTVLHLAVENGHTEMIEFLLENGARVDADNEALYNTPLHIAATTGNKEIADILISNHADINMIRYDYMTPLMNATKSGKKNIVDLLILKGCLLEKQNYMGLTALHISALCGHKDITKTLVENGAKINVQDKNLYTPLHLATQFGHIEVVEALLKSGADVNCLGTDDNTPLHVCALEGYDNIAEMLIDMGADINAENTDNHNPLHVAAKKPCNQNMIALLIRKGIDANVKCCYHTTPLHIASLFGNVQNVRALIQENADVNAKTIHKDTPLHMAAEENHKEIVKILLENGADVNAVNETNSSALLCAVKFGNKDIFDLLIAKGANVNAADGSALSTAIIEGNKILVEALLRIKDISLDLKDHEGHTYLHLAVINGNWNIGKILINKGVEIDAVDNKNITPLSEAVFLGRKEFVNILAENGANINVKVPDPLLQIAVLEGHTDILEILLRLGAVNTEDLDGRYPIEIAAAAGNFEMVKLLIEHLEIDVSNMESREFPLLHCATLSGNQKLVEFLVEKGADMDTRIKYGFKPIHLAVQKRHLGILEYFVKCGMSVEEQTDNYTLLHLASTAGATEITQFLLDNGADVNTVSGKNQPIHIAACNGHLEIFHTLLNYGAVYDESDSTAKTPKEITKNEKIKSTLERIDALFEAVKKNDVATVEKLLCEYVPVNARRRDHFTVLLIAAKYGFREICDLLLENKCNPNLEGVNGETPLHYAAQNSHYEILKALLNYGGVYNALCDSGFTPFDLALQENVKSLLKLVDESFNKVENGNAEIVEDLRALKDKQILKAVLKARNRNMDTLFAVGIKKSFPLIVQELTSIVEENATNLAFAELLLLRHNYKLALSFLKIILEERKDMLGEENPATVNLEFLMATVLVKQSNYVEAMKLYEEIYRKECKIIGKDTKFTLKIECRIVEILQRLGRYKEAFDKLEKVYAKQKEILSEESEDLMEIRMHLASVLNSLKKYDRALKISNENYERCVAKLGKTNSLTLNVYNNMAIILNNLGKYDEAYDIFKNVYETRSKCLGNNSPNTLRARHNMAVTLMAQENFEEALAMFRNVLEQQKIYLEPDNIDCIQTQTNISSVLLLMNEPIEAMKVHRKTANLRKTALGSDHPHFMYIDKQIKEVDLSSKRAGFDFNSTQNHQLGLIDAVAKGNIKSVKKLIESGCDINIADNFGKTALHEAVRCKNEDIVNFLLANGADSSTPDLKGLTPLHEAIFAGDFKIISILIKHYKPVKKDDEFYDFIKKWHRKKMTNKDQPFH